MSPIVSIDRLSKTYDGGFEALKSVSLDIEEGEILALLGPNGAGKTTLISITCGISRPSEGKVTVGGHDVVTDFRAARRLVGLVPQEVNIEPFETVWNTVSFSRGLFGLPKNPAHIEAVLKELSLWDKRNARLVELSGGMKRRVLIAKALSHEPRVLFLDEPTAGVDVELRREMWETVRRLKADRRHDHLTHQPLTHRGGPRPSPTVSVSSPEGRDSCSWRTKLRLNGADGAQDPSVSNLRGDCAHSPAISRRSRGLRPTITRGRTTARLQLRHARSSAPASNAGGFSLKNDTRRGRVALSPTFSTRGQSLPRMGRERGGARGGGDLRQSRGGRTRHELPRRRRHLPV